MRKKAEQQNILALGINSLQKAEQESIHAKKTPVNQSSELGNTFLLNFCLATMSTLPKMGENDWLSLPKMGKGNITA